MKIIENILNNVKCQKDKMKYAKGYDRMILDMVMHLKSPREELNMEKEITKENVEKKPRRKWNDTIPVLYILTFLIMIAGQIFGVLLHQNIVDENASGALMTGMLYFNFICIWIILILYLLLTKKNRFILQEIGTKPSGNNWKYLLAGLFIGFSMNAICILVAWLNKDIQLEFDSFHPVSFLVIAVCVFIQSSAEEVLCRGFLYQRLRKSYQHPAVAIIGNSLFFALLHFANSGVTILSLLNIFLIGVLFSLMVYYMDSLWCAMAAHAAWNFTQNIIFGLPNSGIVLPYSVFKLDASTARDSIVYNVGFGIEGTVSAVIVMCMVCAIFMMKGKKEHNMQA